MILKIEFVKKKTKWDSVYSHGIFYHKPEKDNRWKMHSLWTDYFVFQTNFFYSEAFFIKVTKGYLAEYLCTYFK